MPLQWFPQTDIPSTVGYRVSGQSGDSSLYAVLASRHHDGVALWDSRQGINVVRDTPARRDLVAPLVDALRKDGLKVGLYYSLPDWSYPDYDVFTRKEKRYLLKDDPARGQRYLDYYQGQLKEISDRYDPDLYWFDGDWDTTHRNGSRPKCANSCWRTTRMPSSIRA